MRYLMVGLACLLLGGCQDDKFDFYLYAPAPSCAAEKPCLVLLPAWEGSLSISTPSQTVAYQKRLLGAPGYPPEFGRPKNCKIVDFDNFSCDGLVRVDGAFTNTVEFDFASVSTSHVAYLLGQYLGVEITPDRITFFNNHSIAFVIVILILGTIAWSIIWGAFQVGADINNSKSQQGNSKSRQDLGY